MASTAHCAIVLPEQTTEESIKADNGGRKGDDGALRNSKWPSYPARSEGPGNDGVFGPGRWQELFTSE